MIRKIVLINTIHLLLHNLKYRYRNITAVNCPAHILYNLVYSNDFL